jgi:hypothetical protein
LARNRLPLYAVLLFAGAFAPALAAEPEKRPGPGKMVTVTYPVADLVVPINYPGNRSEDGVEPGKLAKPIPSVEDALMKRIMSKVAPSTWSDKGGGGTMDYFPLPMTLVVNQTPEVQKQVADWIAATRRRHSQSVQFEIRFVSVPDGPLACLGESADQSRVVGKVTSLDEAQAKRVLSALQNDTRANLMQAPRITTLNGWTTPLNILVNRKFLVAPDLPPNNGGLFDEPKTIELPLGESVSVHPVIASDLRTIRIDVEVTLSALTAEPLPLQAPFLTTQRLATTVTLPDKHTAVLEMASREVEVPAAPIPVLADLPLVGAFLHALRSHTEVQRVLVLITPRIESATTTPPQPTF